MASLAFQASLILQLYPPLFQMLLVIIYLLCQPPQVSAIFTLFPSMLRCRLIIARP